MLWFNERTGELAKGPNKPAGMLKVGYWADDRNHGVVENVWGWNFYTSGAGSPALLAAGFLPVDRRRQGLRKFRLGVMKQVSGRYELVMVEKDSTFPVKPADFEFASGYLAEKRDAYRLFELTKSWRAVGRAMSDSANLSRLLEKHMDRLKFSGYRELLDRLPDGMKTRLVARLLCEDLS